MGSKGWQPATAEATQQSQTIFNSRLSNSSGQLSPPPWHPTVAWISPARSGPCRVKQRKNSLLERNVCSRNSSFFIKKSHKKVRLQKLRLSSPGVLLPDAKHKSGPEEAVTLPGSCPLKSVPRDLTLTVMTSCLPQKHPLSMG